MVVNCEFRIPLPITCDEYHVAQLYAVAEESKNETGGGDGVEILVNEPYEKPSGEKGQYTHKTYSIEQKVPRIIRSIAPKGSLKFHEKAWNSFPNCYTEYENEYFGEKFKLLIISRHVNDNCESKPDYGVAPEDLNNLKVFNLNICDNSLLPKNVYQEWSDPNKFQCKKDTARGPFKPDFASTTKPVMTCYKYYKIKCGITLIGGMIESYMVNFVKRFLADFHRKLVCWMDGWHGKTMDDIRELEAHTKLQLEQQIKEDQIRGTVEAD